MYIGAAVPVYVFVVYIGIYVNVHAQKFAFWALWV